MPNGNTAAANTHKATTGLVLLIGIWAFISPWVYGAGMNPNAWNGWIVGALIAIFALLQWGSAASAKGLAWLNMILGAWLFASPWIFNYTGNVGRFINSLCTGAVIFVLSLYVASAPTHRTTLPTTPRT